MGRRWTRIDLTHEIGRMAMWAAMALALIVAVLGAHPATSLAGAATTPCRDCVKLLLPDLVGSARVVIQRGADFEPHYVLAVTVTNVGNAAAGGFGVNVVNGTAKPVSFLAQFSSPGLDAGTSKTFFKPLTRCGFSVTVFVDPTNSVLEANEGNNSFVASLPC